MLLEEASTPAHPPPTDHEIRPDDTATELFQISPAPAHRSWSKPRRPGQRNHPAQPQNHSFATFAPLLDREDGRMDFAARTPQSSTTAGAVFSPGPAHSPFLMARNSSSIAWPLPPNLLLLNRSSPNRKHLRRKPSPLRCLRSQYLARTRRNPDRRQKTPRRPEFLRGVPLAPGARLVESSVHHISSRRAAFQILLAVERGPSHSGDLLRGHSVNALSPADRNLVTTLVLGVLRWQIRLDHQFRPLLKRPNANSIPKSL